eukprot:CAMPEP_0118995144 /NCGR_PEP_ID=MMETSP1173-20130426/58001_1 /TAXON_ID=1034831 /ORGANISM="Rhizochromulina marina cf, Strain CCMP1243" /LENGTH=44 /DNA_ID= /DNA_START= /DNA_END= /DNA_ORIENTATION=
MRRTARLNAGVRGCPVEAFAMPVRSILARRLRSSASSAELSSSP